MNEQLALALGAWITECDAENGIHLTEPMCDELAALLTSCRTALASAAQFSEQAFRVHPNLDLDIDYALRHTPQEQENEKR